MKKISFVLYLVMALVYTTPGAAQSASTLRTQRDSIHALYIFTLDKYDSIAVANTALNEKILEIGQQLTSLKNEINNILEKKNETEALLSDAKKLLGDQAAAIEKLEAEVKRLSQQKKPGQ